jgi:hypothetical protein
MAFSSCVAPEPTYKGETAIVGKLRKDGAPLADAYIRLLDAGKNFVGEVKSDDQGAFHFFCGAGRWHLVCIGAGIDRKEQEVDLGKGDELQVEFAF